MGPMGLPSGVFGGGMNGAIAALLGNQQPQMPKREMEYSNIFGAKGKTGDIMGRIGDALLIASKMDPIYAANKRRFEMGEAMGGFADNPMEAVRRMGQIDQPSALKMLEELRAREADAAGVADKTADNTREDEKFKWDKLEKQDKFRRAVGSMLESSNPGTYDYVKPRVKKFAADREIDLSDLPETYDETYNKGWYMSGIDPKDSLYEANREKDRAFDRSDKRADNYRDQWSKEETARHNRETEEIAGRNADTSRINAERPRTGGGGGNGPSANVKGKVGGGAAKYKVQGGNLFELQSDGSYKFKRKA